MYSCLEYGDRIVEEPDAADIAALVRADTPFWLDIEQPTDAVIDRMAEALELHPLAVEDSKEFEQRAKLVVYGDLVMIVGFGLDPRHGTPVEVHGYLTERFLVTFRRSHSETLARLHTAGSLRRLLGGQPIRILHHLATELHDDFPPYIEQLQGRLRAVETAMLEEPRHEQLAEIISVQRLADNLRRTLTVGRELAARSTVAVSLPGDTTDAGLYAGDIADELRLIVGDLAAVGDSCVAALALHASLANNRQADASRRLAAVATVFLPVTFVVGFFGMNFDVLINDLEQGWPAFVVFGVLLNVVLVVTTSWWLGRRGWS